MIPFDQVNLLAVLVASIATMAAGAFWYSPSGFGKTWMKLTGKTNADKKGEKEAMVQAFVTTFVSVYVIALLLEITSPAGMKEGLTLGFLLWLGLVLPGELEYVIWEKRPVGLCKLNAGHKLVGLLVAIAVLMAF